MRFTYPTIAFFIFIGLISHAGAVTARGVGGTRDGALQDALRNAVQQEVGVELGSSTLTQNFMVVRDQILTKTKGYVTKFKVLEEKQVLGSWEVQVDAEVSQSKLREDLAAQKLLYAAKNKPRIMVLLDERLENQPSFEKTATFKIEETLLAKGFKVVEAEQLDEIRKAESGKARSAEELAKIGFRFGADLILRGNVSAAKAEPRTVYGVQMYNVPVQFNARVVRTDNAEIIASSTNRVQKNSRDAFSAAQFGLEQGGMELGNTLVQKVFDAWQNEVYNTTAVTLEVLKTGTELRKSLEQKLLASGVVKELNLRYMDGADAVYDLDIAGSIHQIREIIEGQKTGFYLQGMSANRMQIAASKPKGEVSYELAAPDLEITAFRITEIFPSRARWYATQSLAEVEIECRNNGAEQVKISVLIPELMSLAAEEKIASLLPGDKKTYKLQLILDAKKLNEIQQTQDLYGQVKVAFQVDGKTQERALNAPVKVYARNTMDWAQTASLATFVTFDHPSVMELSRQIAKMIPKSDFNVDQQQAAAVFEAMSSAGIRYVKDPAGSPGNRSLDRVQFTWQTIASRAGDCDDLTVAFASLVSSLGSDVAIIAYPDHVLSMVNTGLALKNWPALSGDKNMLVPYKGTLWIPVETTMMGKSFTEAWAVASAEYRKAVEQNQPIDVVILSEAWKTWPPFPAPSSEKASWNIQESQVDKSLTDLNTARKASLDAKIATLKSATNNPSAANELGVLQAYNAQYSEAEKSFSASSSNSWKVQNNYAMSLMLQGKEADALAKLQAIADKAPEVQVNLAICEYLMATDEAGMERFIENLKAARAKMKSDEGLEIALGIDLGTKGGIRGADGHAKAAPKQLNRRELRELIRTRVLAADAQVTKSSSSGKNTSASRNTVPFGGVRGADPEQVAHVVNLIYWYEEI